MRPRAYAVVAVLCSLPAVAARAQAPAPSPAGPQISVSGILFANYQYRTRPRDAVSNKFDLDRAYVNVRARIGERTSIRVTTDVFQQERDTVNRSWTVRAKYAWLQYDYLSNLRWDANVRIGLIPTVFIEHDESFWPRWISTTPTDRHGYFSSADAGITNQILGPHGRGELYTTITNGPGFGSREIDRFKDVASRLTIRPIGQNPANPWRSLTLSVWGYKGALASKFARGGTGQVGSVGSALVRDRYGVFAAIAHPRLTAAVQYAQRNDEGETGANTVAAPRAVIDSTGSVAAGYAIIRPFGAANTRRGRLALVGRWDRVTTNRDADTGYDLYIAGLIADLSSAASLSLDWQEQAPRAAGIGRTRTFFLHTVARF